MTSKRRAPTTVVEALDQAAEVRKRRVRPSQWELLQAAKLQGRIWDGMSPEEYAAATQRALHTSDIWFKG